MMNNGLNNGTVVANGLKVTKINSAADVASLEARMENLLYSPKMTAKTATMLMSMQKAHKKSAKKIMASLYEFYPVYRKFESDKDGNITMKYTIGGNTPVVREFDIETKKDKVVASVTDTGVEYVVETGAGQRYGKINDIIAISAKKNTDFMKDSIANSVFVKDDKIVESDVEGAEEYKIFIWSNSNERNVEALFVNAKKFPGNSAMELIDKVSGGSFSAKIQDAIDNNGGEMPFKKFAKIGTRLGIMHTPAVDTKANVKRIVFIDGDLLGTDDMALDSEYMKANGFDGTLADFLGSHGIDNDKNTYDGAVYISEDALERMFNAMGLDMPKYMIRLIAAQNRSEGLMSKVFAEASRQEVMEAIVKYAYALLEKGLVDAVHEIGDKNAPIDMVIDTNGAKLPNMDRVLNPNDEGFKVWILNIAKASISRTSGQMIEKFMALDMDKTVDFLKGHSASKAEEILTNKLDAELSLSYDEKVGNYELQGDIIQNLLTVNPERFMRDREAMKKLLKDSATWQESAVKGGSVEIDSLYHHVLFDITRMITNGKIDYILGYDKDLMAVQGFSLDVIVKNAQAIAEIESDETLSTKERKAKLDDIMTAVIIKYPTPGKEEYEVVRYLTKSEVLAIINSKVAMVSATMDEKEVKQLTKTLRRYFFETSFGVVKLAPLNILKNKLAGMDTDYDAICSIFERVFVDMAVNEIQNKCYNGSTVYISYGDEELVAPVQDTVVWAGEEEVDF